MTEAVAMAMERAASAALQFLLRRQTGDGCWRDFLLPAGQSDAWVTAYVGYVLAGLASPPARDAAAAAWRWLQNTERPGGGWSYNAAVPGDADSTLWGLRLAAALGESESMRARAAARFLAAHVRDDGGLSTYVDRQAIRGYVGLPDSFSFDGWLQSHVCVTAAGAGLEALAARLCPYLQRRQTQAGHWRSYWWLADEYATSEAAAAMVATSTSGDVREQVARALRWAEQRIPLLCAKQDGRPPTFALALALRVPLLDHGQSPDRSVVRLGIERLCEWQKQDGSWPASARLRVPRPDVIDPGSPGPPGPIDSWRMWRGLPPGPPTPQIVLDHTFNNYSLDATSVFTTATALRTLELARRAS
jgi:hypothetical protein